jgi:hypothetical protein
MTFTFTDDLTDNGDYVRFHTGDTVSPGFMSDALIDSLIAVEGTPNKAVIAGLKYIIAQLSRPDFRADWLQVSSADARQGYQAMLAEKRAELGIARLTTTVTHTYRADSDADEEPDWDAYSS